MNTLTENEIDAVSGAGEGSYHAGYGVGYLVGAGISELNQLGSWLGSEFYDLMHH